MLPAATELARRLPELLDVLPVVELVVGFCGHAGRSRSTEGSELIDR